MKYYYTCPIKALYMMKEFGVKLESRFDDYEEIYDFEDMGVDAADIKELLENFNDKCYGKIFVAKESESIFQPKKDDKHFFMPEVE